jgi:outer membrane protein OmpA-like peptidoglycan-associated protein
MRRELIVVAVAIALALSTITLPGALTAQEQFTDCRGRKCTTEELSRALFSEPEPQIRTRGVAPQTQVPPPPTDNAVALNVFFEFGSATILKQYYSDLDTLGSVLTQPQYNAYRIRIEGHTDSVGSEGYNQELSEKRAASIKQYLVQRFTIAPDRLTVQGHGEGKPRFTNDTTEGRGQNRRVEVKNLGK